MRRLRLHPEKPQWLYLFRPASFEDILLLVLNGDPLLCRKFVYNLVLRLIAHAQRAGGSCSQEDLC